MVEVLVGNQDDVRFVVALSFERVDDNSLRTLKHERVMAEPMDLDSGRS